MTVRWLNVGFIVQDFDILEGKIYCIHIILLRIWENTVLIKYAFNLIIWQICSVYFQQKIEISAEEYVLILIY